MDKISKIEQFSIQPYLDANRTKLDESLVSLRLMKEIDDFIEINDINQKDLASKLGYSNAYISQLMAGVKKINTSFINRFEKKFNLQIEFKIKCKENSSYYSKVVEHNSNINLFININFHSGAFLNIREETFNKKFNIIQKYSLKEDVDYLSVTEDYLSLK